MGLNNTYIGQQSATGKKQGSFHPLLVDEQAKCGATHRAIVTFGDIPAGIATATALELNIAPLVAKNLLECIAVKLVTPFAISADAAYITTPITVGDGTTANQHLTTYETNLNAPPTDYIKQGQRVTGIKDYTAADAITITFAAPAAGKTLSSMDQGEVHIYFKLLDGNPAPA